MKKNVKKSITSKQNLILHPINPCVGGIDIGSRSVFVCIGSQNGEQTCREFETFTEDLISMVKWLQENGIKSVAMESTSVYWIPVYDILAQAELEVLLVNPRHLKTVPGRKTDVKDCQWIQQLHAYGLLQGSFRPDDEGVTLRGYVRQRSILFEKAAQQVQLMHKALVQMNLRINHVVVDITGATGMRIIRAILAGERDPHVLAKNRDHRCRKDEETIAKALVGNYRPEHLLSLRQALDAYDFFHRQVLDCEKEMEKLLHRRSVEIQKDSQSEIESTTEGDLNSISQKTNQSENATVQTIELNSSFSAMDSSAVGLPQLSDQLPKNNHPIETPLVRELFESDKSAVQSSLEPIQKSEQDVKKSTKNSSLDKKNVKKRKILLKTKYDPGSYCFDVAENLKNILGVDLTEVPGINVNSLMRIIGEIGTNISQWPSSKHFASWLGLCPGNKISGGKILSGKTKPSANRAAYALRLAANSLYNSPTALGAFLRRMKARIGSPKAITATAHKLAKILYHMLKNRTSFTEIGSGVAEMLYEEKQLRSMKKQAQKLGYQLMPI